MGGPHARRHGATLALITTLGLAAALAAWLWPRGAPPPARTMPAASGSPAVAAQAAPPGPAVAPSASPTDAARAARFADWVQQHSAVRGTQMDGDWGVDVAGQLQPSRALRRRFDHLLLMQGQVPVDEIGRHLDHLARQALTQPAADAVMEVWARYLRLQQTPLRTLPQPQDPASLAAALAERQRQRRALLGPAWAHAFYADEEAQLAELLNESAQPGAARPETPALIDRNSLDAAALQRLREEEAYQAQWQTRLDAARQALRQLDRDGQLSEPQRRQARQALLEQRFDTAERRRAAALLGLADAPP
ncbi:lipase chaperone [Pelomonas sp. CA6]|uniref:lipase chaperone n=1 Tax=Pelomonas sp. CA6 TaxID=2907999 RepID=UPI001F4B9A2F|nr:lipase chaperone [Pelomonas sp. CA6]MCH7342643.1 lipase chaperone [Pelomonas sp. CA6]